MNLNPHRRKKNKKRFEQELEKTDLPVLLETSLLIFLLFPFLVLVCMHIHVHSNTFSRNRPLSREVNIFASHVHAIVQNRRFTAWKMSEIGWSARIILHQTAVWDGKLMLSSRDLHVSYSFLFLFFLSLFRETKEKNKSRQNMNKKIKLWYCSSSGSASRAWHGELLHCYFPHKRRTLNVSPLPRELQILLNTF